MGVETNEVRDLQEKYDDPVEALFNSLKRKGMPVPYPKETVFRVFVGCLNDCDDRIEYEQLLTQSFRCQNVLKKPGDLAIVKLDGTFDKDGAYHVAARYAVIPEASK